jgi:hypothetical protein
MMKATKIFKLIMLGVIVFGVNTGIVNAAFITGGMGITGNYGADAATLTLNTATGTSGTGDFDDLLFPLNTVTFGTPGAIVNGGIVYDPFTTPVVDVLEISGWQLDLATLIIDPASTTEKLKLSGTGLLSGNGFDATSATWTFSAQNASSYSMSITAAVVPVPAAVWLFGSGLIGLVGLARRKA